MPLVDELGFYKTREGLKAEVVYIAPQVDKGGEQVVAVIQEADGIRLVTTDGDGFFYANSKSETRFDLVSKWKDEVIARCYLSVFANGEVTCSTFPGAFRHMAGFVREVFFEEMV